MSGNVADLLVDSDVLVDHLRGIRRLETGGHRLHYSVITRAELFAGHATEERRVRRLLDSLVELTLDRSTAERAGRLRRRHAVRLPDALIAATALEHRMALMTRNVRDYEPIKGLRIRPSV
jgi:predicted nucleic acid-binding protein